MMFTLKLDNHNLKILTWHLGLRHATYYSLAGKLSSATNKHTEIVKKRSDLKSLTMHKETI